MTAYSANSAQLSTVLRPYQLSPQYSSLHRSLGLDTKKPHNIAYLGDGRLLTIGGNTVQIIDTNNVTKIILRGHGASGGIGAIAVSPDRSHFAVASNGDHPSIFIYRTDDTAIVKVCKGGAELGFGCLSFDSTGARLASVSRSPDYLLCVWDWAQERCVLRTKAFSQEVTNVAFSPYFPGELVTSGLGHIRFWSIASTFTGLKLQGAIGKFALVELSDIDAFCQLSDGKVISGSETGALLVWDGHTIAYEIRRSSTDLCHNGPITAVLLCGDEVLTAGLDGWIRFWKLSDFEASDNGEDDSMWLDVKPTREFDLSSQVSIASLSQGDEGEFFIADHDGGIVRWSPVADSMTGNINRVSSTHSGAVTCSVMSSSSHSFVTGGDDGSLRAWDIRSGALLYSRRFASACTVLHQATPACDPQHQSTIIAGFADGLIRVVHRYLESFTLVTSAKPHTSAIQSIATSMDGRILVTADSTGAVFFFSMQAGSRCSSLEPIGLIRLAAPVHCMSFSSYSPRLLLCASEDKVIEITAPEPDTRSDSDSYSIIVKKHEWVCDFSKIVPEEDADQISKEELDIARLKRIERERELTEAERDDGKKRRDAREERRRKRQQSKSNEANRRYHIGSLIHAPHSGSDFLFSIRPAPSDPHPNVYPRMKVEAVYRASINAVAPRHEFSLGLGAGLVTSLALTPSHSAILIGTDRGRVQLRSVHESQWYFELGLHDGDSRVTSVNATFDDRFIISTGADAMIFCQSVDSLTALALADRSVEAAATMEKERRTELRKERRKALLDEASAAIAATDIDADSEDSENEKIQFQQRQITQIPALPPFKEGDLADDALSLATPDVLPSAMESVDAPDTWTSSSYSLEEAKLAAEEDERQREVGRKQVTLKEEIDECRREFDELNAKRLEFARQLKEAGFANEALHDSEFELDAELQQSIEQSTQTQLAQLEEDMAYDMKKHECQLDKLMRFFYDPVEIDSFKVDSFALPDTDPSRGAQPSSIVWSYRVAKLPSSLKREIAAVHEGLKQDRARKMERVASPANRLVEANQADDFTSDLSHSLSATMNLSATADRDSLRIARTERLQWMETNRPDGKALSPAELLELETCGNSLGDFKLKSAADFVVTEDRAVNAHVKRTELVLLCESIYELKMAFNDKLQALNSIKERLCQSIRSDRKMFQSGDVRDQMLSNVGAEQASGLVTTLELIDQICIEHGDLVPAKPATPAVATPSEPVCLTDQQRMSRPATAKVEESFDFLDVTEEQLRRAENAERECSLVTRIRTALLEFNAALRSLQFDRLKLDDDLCAAEARLLLCHTELTILADFEERELMINERRKKLSEAKKVMKNEQSELERVCSLKLKDLTQAQERDRAIAVEFAQAIGGEKNEFFGILNKIFRKKIKRRKRKMNPNGMINTIAQKKLEGESKQQTDADDNTDATDERGSDNGSGDDMSDSGGESGMDSGDDSDYDDMGSDSASDDSDMDGDEICPPHCPVVAYEKTLEFRDRRLDNDELIDMLQKSLQELSRAIERIQNKEKALDRDWQQLERERQAFQSDKQRQLNLVEAAATIDANQCQIVRADGSLPPTLNQSLVFTDSMLNTLRGRIETIKNEKSTLSQSLNERRRAGRLVERTNDDWRAKIQDERRRCENVQTLKFGRLVDLEFILNNMQQKTSPAAEAKKASLQEMERANRQMVERGRLSLNEARLELKHAMKQNTKLLEQQGELTSTQFQLEDRLNASSSGTASVTVIPGDQEMEAEMEKRDLLKLVQVQEKEIEQLKAEMSVLRRKGGVLIH